MIKHKFKAIATVTDGIKFPSKKEARRYVELKTLQTAGKVLFFLRQTPFHLDANVKYVCDFVVFWIDGNVTFEDVKGVKTAMYVLKKKQVEARYGVTITEI